MALSITREQAVSAVENKYRRGLLRDVFLGRAGSEEFVREHVVGLRLGLRGPMVVVVAQLDPRRGNTVEDQRQWQQRFANAWRQVTVPWTGIPVADFGSRSSRCSRGGPDGAATLVRRLVRAVAGDKGGGRRPLGRRRTRVAARGRRAVDATPRPGGGRGGPPGRGDGTTTWFDTLGLHRLIAMVPGRRERLLCLRPRRPRSSSPTRPEAATLPRETLQVLLNTNFNVAEAARLQFFQTTTPCATGWPAGAAARSVASDQNLPAGRGGGAEGARVVRR